MSPRLPDRYGRTDLTLMVVHPLLVYAYWEVTTESSRRAQKVLGAQGDGARAVIRMYDISLIHFDGTNANYVFDIDVALEASGWYIHLWAPEKSYCADLGFIARTGRFQSMVRSNIIHTPRAAPSPRTDEQWMKMTFARRGKRKRTMEYVPAPAMGPNLTDEQLRLQHERFLKGTVSSLAAYLSSAPSSRQR